MAPTPAKGPTLYVKPARSDLVVREPGTMKRIPAEGQKVANSSYWRRRLAKGDVVEARPPAKPKSPNKPSAAAATSEQES